jgi:hypothetical protein
MTDLKENHKRSLLIGFRYVDDLLSDIERIMATSMDPQSPFEKYVADIRPAQQKIIAADIAHIRIVMCRILESKGINVKHPGISAVSAIRTAIHFADIAMEEKRPKYMRGYGELTEEAVRELNEVASQMQKLLKQILKALR